MSFSFSLQLTTSDADEASSASSSEACFRLGIFSVKANFQPVPRNVHVFLDLIILSDANFVSVPNTLSCRYIHRFVRDYCDTFYPLLATIVSRPFNYYFQNEILTKYLLGQKVTFLTLVRGFGSFQ